MAGGEGCMCLCVWPIATSWSAVHTSPACAASHSSEAIGDLAGPRALLEGLLRSALVPFAARTTENNIKLFAKLFALAQRVCFFCKEFESDLQRTRKYIFLAQKMKV